jgi:hypothetical protein
MSSKRCQVIGGMNEREEIRTMKTINAKMLLPLAAVALAAPFFAFAVFVGLRAVELATDSRQNILLLALAVVAVVSGAMGSRGSRQSKPARERRWTVAEGRTRNARGTTALHPGL